MVMRRLLSPPTVSGGAPEERANHRFQKGLCAGLAGGAGAGP